MPDPAQRSAVALLASRSQWVARSLDSILSPHGYAVLRLYSGRQVLEQARAARPDVLLLDASLPDIGGVKLCRMLRESTAVDATTPIIITSPEPVAREARLEALRAGAWDHVVLPIDAEELRLKLIVYLQSKAHADTLREVGLVDPVTGCYTPRGLLRRAREVGADASRTARPLGCVTLAASLDDAGSEAGEPQVPGTAEVIRQVGTLIDRGTRDSDSVGRVGQSEFLVLAPDTDAGGVVSLAERLASTAESLVMVEDGRPLSVRVGCYAVPNFRDATIDTVELMTRSTLALRQAQAAEAAQRVRFYRAGAAS